MKESEAIELFKERLVFIKEHYSEEVKCYEEALEIGIQALEKQIPKRLIASQCVTCGNALLPFEGNYCSKCGCRLDWGDSD